MSDPHEVSVRTDAAGRVVAAAGPGLVDLQLNGYAGVSFNGPVADLTPDAVAAVCRRLRRRGTVAILATLTTDDVEVMLARAKRLADLRAADASIAAMIAGLHVEGPMLNPADGPRGAHTAECLLVPADRPRIVEEFQQASGGLVRVLTLAPELPGAMAMIASAADAGVTVGLGHHEADADCLADAVAAGARMCTHLGNGSGATLPRLDNYIQRQLADDRLAASFIADGHHIPFPTLKNLLRAKGVSRSVLVTDAILAADMPPGEYNSGRRHRRLDADGAVRLTGTPYLAGSALTGDRGVLNVAAHCGVSFEDAWAMASTRPAELVGLPAPEPIQVDVGDDGFRLRE